jgi:hypothetical protein
MLFRRYLFLFSWASFILFLSTFLSYLAVFKFWKKKITTAIGLLLVVFLSLGLCAKVVYKDLKRRRFLKAGKKIAAFPARKIPFSSITSTQLILNTNKIMRNVFNAILDIRNRFPELKNFNEKHFKRGYEIIYGKDCWGYCPPWEVARISYGAISDNPEDNVFLDICFTEFPYNEYTDETPPIIQIYVERLQHWLCVVLQSQNPALKNEMAVIARYSVKEFTTKEFYTPLEVSQFLNR